MNDALSQLHDIHLPDPIGWWPMAFSWWVLLFSISAILVALIWFLFDRHRRNAYRREAFSKLDQINKDPSLSPQQKLTAINSILKQVAITVYGRQKIAELNGQAWLDFLKSRANFIQQPEGLSDVFELQYVPQAQLDETHLRQSVDTVQHYAKQWIKGHHL